MSSLRLEGKKKDKYVDNSEGNRGLLPGFFLSDLNLPQAKSAWVGLIGKTGLAGAVSTGQDISKQPTAS